MDWEQVRKDFEAWRKKFLKRRDYTVNDKRRDLEPTGNESPPDVYGLNRPQGTFVNAIFEQLLDMQNQSYTLRPGYMLMPSPEEAKRMVGMNVSGPTREEPIKNDDITDIQIALENSNDVNDFIEEM